MLTREAAIERYGGVDLSGVGHWPDCNKWMTLINVPRGAFPNFTIMDTKIPVTHMSVNKDIAVPLWRAFELLIERGLNEELKTYDGCQNIRLIRGSRTELSAHCWGLAIDLNAATNRLGYRGDMRIEVVECFTLQGFSWGGEFKRLDPMHLSFAGWE